MKIVFVQRAILGNDGMAASYYFPTKLSELGHQVRVVGAKGGNAARFHGTGVDVVELKPGFGWFRAVAQAIASFHPDIVHVFNHAGCGVYPFLASRDLRTRFVLDIRSPLLRTGVLRRIVRLKNRLEVRGYKEIFAHSIESGRTVVGCGRELNLAPVGVDFSMLPPIVPHRQVEPLRLIYVGTLDHKRQLRNMIEGVCIAHNKINLTLDIYGQGSGESSLRQLVMRSHAQGFIVFHGRIERHQLFEEITKAHGGLAYIPKQLYDAAPALKTIEYLACGVPVVATDTLGNTGIIKSGENGILAGESPAAFAQGIESLVSSGLVNLPGENFRDSVKTYDWEYIVTQMLLPRYKSCACTAM